MSAPATQEDLAFGIEHQMVRMANEREVWPGFEPLAIPLAVFTGERTVLFRHPSPPNGFVPLTEAGQQPAPHVYEGRHPLLTANTSAEIGGTLTATLLAGEPGTNRSVADLAATAFHEAFHVYQRRQHPGWIADEGALFLYPVDDAVLLALRRIESETLRRALAAGDQAQAACWSRVALAVRRQRFAGMDPAFSAYERLSELNEGLATYVQLTAAGRATVDIRDAECGTSAIRQRSYSSGAGLGFLLDRLRPDWKTTLESEDASSLDEILQAALGAGVEGGPAPCALSDDESAAIDDAAQADVAALLSRRDEQRKRFDARPGWRVILQAEPGHPLWPQGFDPLNVERVEGGLLHARFLRLGNDSGHFEIVEGPGADLEILTVGVGPHPLFQGIVRAEVAGLQKPEVTTTGSRVVLRSSGLSAELDDARVEIEEETVLVHLAPAR